MDCGSSQSIRERVSNTAQMNKMGADEISKSFYKSMDPYLPVIETESADISYRNLSSYSWYLKFGTPWVRCDFFRADCRKTPPSVRQIFFPVASVIRIEKISRFVGSNLLNIDCTKGANRKQQQCHPWGILAKPLRPTHWISCNEWAYDLHWLSCIFLRGQRRTADLTNRAKQFLGFMVDISKNDK